MAQNDEGTEARLDAAGSASTMAPKKFKTQNVNSLFLAAADKQATNEEARDSASPGPSAPTRRAGTLATASGQYKLAAIKKEEPAREESAWSPKPEEEHKETKDHEEGAKHDESKAAAKSSFDMSEEELAKKGISLISRFAPKDGFNWDDDDDDWSAPANVLPTDTAKEPTPTASAHTGAGASGDAKAAGKSSGPVEPESAPWASAKPAASSKSLQERIRELKEGKPDASVPVPRPGPGHRAPRAMGGASGGPSNGDGLSRFRIRNTDPLEHPDHDPLSRDLNISEPRGHFDGPFGRDPRRRGSGSYDRFDRFEHRDRFESRDRFDHHDRHHDHHEHRDRFNNIPEDDFEGRAMGGSWRNGPGPMRNQSPPPPRHILRRNELPPAAEHHKFTPQRRESNASENTTVSTSSADAATPAAVAPATPAAPPAAPPASKDELIKEQHEMMKKARDAAAERRREDDRREEEERKARLAARLKAVDDRLEAKHKEEAEHKRKEAEEREAKREAERKAREARQEEERAKRLEQERERAARNAHPAFSDESWIARKTATAAAKNASEEQPTRNKWSKDRSEEPNHTPHHKERPTKPTKPLRLPLPVPRASPTIYSIRSDEATVELARQIASHAGVGSNDAETTDTTQRSSSLSSGDSDNVTTAATTPASSPVVGIKGSKGRQVPVSLPTESDDEIISLAGDFSNHFKILGEPSQAPLGFGTTLVSMENDQRYWREPLKRPKREIRRGGGPKWRGRGGKF